MYMMAMPLNWQMKLLKKSEVYMAILSQLFPIQAAGIPQIQSNIVSGRGQEEKTILSLYDAPLKVYLVDY